MTEKQKKFCDEYLIDLNATQAAIRAGYSKRTAYSIGVENLRKPEIQNYLERRQRERQERTEIDQDLIIKHLAMIGLLELTDSKMITGIVKASDKIKALELLGKHNGMFTDKISVTTAIPVVITGGDELAD